MATIDKIRVKSGSTSTDYDIAVAGSNVSGTVANATNATTATKLGTATKGSTTQPIYLNAGAPTACSYTLGASVPSNAKFTDTTYSNFVGSGSGAKAGLVPAPSTTAGTTKYLREDGSWSVPPDTNTTYSVASQSTNGLMSSADKTKLDNIQASADAVSFTRSLTSGTKIGTITINGSGTDIYCEKNTDTTYSNMTAATSSAAGKAGLVPAPAAGAQAKYLRGDGTWQTPPTSYTLPAATSSTLGGVKTSTGITNSSGTISVAYGTTASTACVGNDSRLSNARTPVAHASTATTYGAGNASNYGHVKLSDNYTTSDGAASAGVAASSYALNQCYNTLNSNLSSFENRFAYVGGWVQKGRQDSVNINYPSGWNRNNTVISGVRCKTSYGTFVDNTYSDSYAIGIVFGETIGVYPHDSNSNYTEFTIHLFKWG